MPTEQWVTNEIKALKQAHAELAAEMASRFRDHSGMIVGVLEEVNRLRTRYEAHLLVHELDALESDAAPDDSAETPAQQRYREANERHYSNREVEMAAGAFDRAEEVAQELDDWTHLIHMRLNTMSIRLTALESPAPAPDPVCARCKHSKRDHKDVCRADHAFEDGPCGCKAFVPTAEPAPLDPVQFHIAEAYRAIPDDQIGKMVARALRDAWRQLHELPERADVHFDMLAYGRDGAR